MCIRQPPRSSPRIYRWTSPLPAHAHALVADGIDGLVLLGTVGETTRCGPRRNVSRCAPRSRPWAAGCRWSRASPTDHRSRHRIRARRGEDRHRCVDGSSGHGVRADAGRAVRAFSRRGRSHRTAHHAVHIRRPYRVSIEIETLERLAAIPTSWRSRKARPIAAFHGPRQSLRRALRIARGPRRRGARGLPAGRGGLGLRSHQRIPARVGGHGGRSQAWRLGRGATHLSLVHAAVALDPITTWCSRSSSPNRSGPRFGTRTHAAAAVVRRAPCRRIARVERCKATRPVAAPGAAA